MSLILQYSETWMRLLVYSNSGAQSFSSYSDIKLDSSWKETYKDYISIFTWYIKIELGFHRFTNKY